MWGLPVLSCTAALAMFPLSDIDSGIGKSPKNGPSAASAGTADDASKMLPRVLCLHGKYQSASTFRNKIAGARRKLARSYELHFLDGPVLLEDDGGYGASGPRAWWVRNEEGTSNVGCYEAMEYVREAATAAGGDGRVGYDAIIGFSQGGSLATALAAGGVLPGVKAVVTAGAPMVEEAFGAAESLARVEAERKVSERGTTASAEAAAAMSERGLAIPKFHLAGERDRMIPVQSTRALCDRGGCGTLVVHEQGHLFPTRSAVVGQVLEFLEKALPPPRKMTKRGIRRDEENHKGHQD